VKPVDKKGRIWRAVRGRSDKVPGRRQAVNDSPKTALSAGVEVNRLSEARAANRNFLARIRYNP
jgi:hypothetical protein